jgi:branched-subunit amino acid aminotransferase/4-amino-4-deoxychorismate lyase
MSLSAFRIKSNRLIPLKTDVTSPDELTRQLPRGLYSTFSTNHGGTRILGLTAHLDRLYLPAQARNLTPSASRADLQPALAKLAKSNAPGESRFRLLLTADTGTLYIIVQPFAGLPKEIYERGVHVVTAELTRHDPRLKDTRFISESQSARALVGGDVFEVLLTHKGKIYEGMTSNFYAVTPSVVANRKDHSPRNDEVTLITARQGILLGVTRRAVLRLARGQGMNITYRFPRLDENFSETFLTSSSRGVVPIVSIDGSRVGEGRPGAWTKRLSLAYQAYVEERSEMLVR